MSDDDRPAHLLNMATPSKITDVSQLKPMALQPLPPNPLVSVLMCNYNYGRYIGQAIESVLGQTWSNWELIICDDGSTDSSREIIAHYASLDKRIHLFEQENRGQASALNAAYSACSGGIITLLDSDDLFYSNKLEAVIGAFREAPQSGLVAHCLDVIDSSNKKTGLLMPSHFSSGWLAPHMFATSESELPPTSGLCFRRELAELIFPIPASLRICADWQVHVVASLLTYVERAPICGSYRLHPENSLHLRPPSESNYSKILAWQHTTHAIMVNFVQMNISEALASTLSIDRSSAYNSTILKYFILTRRWPEHIDTQPMSERLDKLRGNATTSTIWRTLVKLPRFIAVPIFLLWQGQYPLKRFIPAWIRRPLHSQFDKATSSKTSLRGGNYQDR